MFRKSGRRAGRQAQTMPTQGSTKASMRLSASIPESIRRVRKENDRRDGGGRVLTGNVLDVECYVDHHVITDYTRQDVTVCIVSHYMPCFCCKGR